MPWAFFSAVAAAASVATAPRMMRRRNRQPPETRRHGDIRPQAAPKRTARSRARLPAEDPDRARLRRRGRVAAGAARSALGAGSATSVLLKREDTQPVFSFKLRGAYNKMAHLAPEQLARGVICASAGNHAQGVALGARRARLPGRRSSCR